MAKPLGITIPDDLYERLQDVKNRINISGECQEAIEKAVYLEELKIKESSNMEESTIERLRAEKEKHDEEYRDMGYKDGIRDAKILPYDALIEIINDKASWWEAEWFVNYVEADVKDYENDDAGFDREHYVECWLEGVKEFYENIKDQI